MTKAKGQEPEHTGAGNDLYKSGRTGLSDKQQLAIDLLLIGTKYQDVAKAVDISREQLWRWRTQDISFMAARELSRAELHEGVTDQFWGALVPQAITVAAESLAEGDPEMARDIIRLAARGLTDLKMRNPEPPSEDGA